MPARRLPSLRARGGDKRPSQWDASQASVELSCMAFLGYFKSNLMQIPVGEMFEKSIFTSTEGLIFVYVTLYNPPHPVLRGAFLWPNISRQNCFVFKISHLYRTCWKKCCRSSATSIQKYLFYKVACFLWNPSTV